MPQPMNEEKMRVTTPPPLGTHLWLNLRFSLALTICELFFVSSKCVNLIRVFLHELFSLFRHSMLNDLIFPCVDTLVLGLLCCTLCPF